MRKWALIIGICFTMFVSSAGAETTMENIVDRYSRQAAKLPNTCQTAPKMGSFIKLTNGGYAAISLWLPDNKTLKVELVTWLPDEPKHITVGYYMPNLKDVVFTRFFRGGQFDDYRIRGAVIGIPDGGS